MEKEKVLMALGRMGKEERREWLERINPERGVIDGRALAALIDECGLERPGAEVVTAMSADEIVEWVRQMNRGIYRIK